MASENKKRKGKNAYISNLGLKSKKVGIKKLDFILHRIDRKIKIMTILKSRENIFSLLLLLIVIS